jgi:uncharacterized protein (TIGR04255 family)
VNPTRLARPPIREAILDIRIEGQQDLGALNALAGAFSAESGMTKRASIRAGMVEMALDPNKAFSGQAKDVGLIGYRIQDEPLTRVAQFRNNGFTFSLIGNYDCWERFRDQGIVPARRFLELPNTGRVKRVALRYVNVLQFPLERVDLDEYLPAAPKIPAELPQVVGSFFSRVAIPIPEAQLVAMVTQALDEAPRPTPSVILDIDVFSQGQLAANLDSVLPVLETIRVWKNRIFFAFVNENTVRLHS